jgi:putative transposase
MLDWPHGPTHRLESAGAYMVTAATYQKQPFFRTAARLTFLCDSLLHLLPKYGWKLEAWAVFPNHYHFVAISQQKAVTLRKLIGHLHTITAKEINRKDKASGRKVWFQYWDSHLTYPRSYLARLNYVHCNAVRHGLVREPSQYAWCSAGWFEGEADRPFYQTVMRIRSDRVNVVDDFTVDPADIM